MSIVQTLLNRARSVSLWSWLALGGVAGAQFVQTIRASVGRTELDLVNLLLGAGPNFFAAFAIAFIGLAFKFPKSGTGRADSSVLTLWFSVSASVAVVGLLGWEFLQRTGRLVFDPWDVGATVAGVALAALIFFSSLPPRGGHTV